MKTQKDNVGFNDPDLRENLQQNIDRLIRMGDPSITKVGGVIVKTGIRKPKQLRLRKWALPFAQMDVDGLIDEYKKLLLKTSSRSRKEREFLKEMFEDAVARTHKNRPNGDEEE